MGLSDAAGRKPAELSGGMKQWVRIARALAAEPSLLDEPFSALDALTRGTLQDEVLRLVSDAGQTAFLITHDVDEAILLAGRILLMTNGPDARVAEAVVNTLPRPRDRQTIHRTPGHHALRSHILDFLMARSRTLAGARPENWDTRRVPEVRPAATPIEETINWTTPKPPWASRSAASRSRKAGPGRRSPGSSATLPCGPAPPVWAR